MSCNGKVIPHTPLAVDFWQVRKCPGTRLFFLSHMHSDHTVGLTSTWSDRPIYCSPTTAILLKLKLQVKEQWIHPLELGQPHLLPLDDINKERLTVTLIDANHCPGAVMFLFEGYFGSILYTGDFRYSPSMLREDCLRNNTTIDVLYLDNTNCDPNRTIPTRHRATQQIKEIIRSHPNHNVVIGLYGLGKESLLLDLAMEFKTWIEVSFERMEILKALELPNVFTNERGAGRIQAVDQSTIDGAALQKWNKEQPTLAIIPTSRPIFFVQPNIHVVPYSDHSSYQELEDFVCALKPTSIVPIVGNYVPESISALLPIKKRHEILVPESVLQYMLRQPESSLSLSAHTSLHRRHCRPSVPKGVIFESPERGSIKSYEEAWEAESPERDVFDEEMDTESSGKESYRILSDQNKELSPNTHLRGTGDVWSIQSMSEELILAETEPLSKSTILTLASLEFPKNTKAFLKPVRTAGKPFITNTTTNSTQSNYSCLPKRHETTVDYHSLSDSDSLSLLSGQGTSQDEDSMSTNTSQHGGLGNNQNNTVTPYPESPDSSSCMSLMFSVDEHQEYMEELENSILKDLLFSVEDFKACGLLQKSFVKQFPLCPLNKNDVDNVPNT
ncbi:' exonuclease Apollo [Xyrichtys novacula]|uniref:5' exonuclease Apollo n=1 Tax=Xyrichtys novacula TaxID=13765 RepID=A0AAV1HJG8_XYRNO|nr:' exonuclease Apollo [Xyrichtys novacula]